VRTGRQRFSFYFLAAAIAVALASPIMPQNTSPLPARDINAVLAAHDQELLAIPGVVGVYVGTLDDRHTTCLKVMLAQDTAEARRAIPASIEGYTVLIEITGEIRALGKP